MLAMYVISIRTLYEPCAISKIKRAETVIEKYHQCLEDFFGIFAYTSTIHSHLHLAEQVRKHGPLQMNSQFIFEV